MAQQVQKGLGMAAADAAINAQKRRPSKGQSGDQWKAIQADTFKNWINAQLTKGGFDPIDDLAEDLQSGVVLIRLLQVLTDKKIGKYASNPRTKFQKLENLNKAFQFIQNEGLKLVNIGAPDIESGNLMLILGLIWTIMYHYQILPALASNTGKSAKELLLEWVRSKIPEYNISNFTTDWNDGRAICALANAVAGSPPIVKEIASMTAMTKERNASRGIDEAYEWLGIPKVISPENMANPALDDLSMMTYISYFKGAKRRTVPMSEVEASMGKSGAAAAAASSSSSSAGDDDSSAAAAPVQQQQQEEKKEDEAVQETTAAVAATNISGKKPWERGDDWRTYEGHNLGGRNKICVYYSTTTSSSVIRKRTEELMRLMERLKLHERPDYKPWIPIDVDMDSDTRKKLFEKAGTRETPMLFVDDEFVGTYERIMELNEQGQLERIFEY